VCQAEVAAVAVAVVEYLHEGAMKRIPDDLTGIPFFGKSDAWAYVAVMDDALCDECENFQEIGIFDGNALRSIFPYMLILDEDTIAVSVHPNCRCFLFRLEESEEPLV
jgi:hypothetical protein